MFGVSVVVLSFPLLTYATMWPLPVQTVPGEDALDPQGWTPKPTAAMGAMDLFRRQAIPSAVCGYIDGAARE